MICPFCSIGFNITGSTITIQLKDDSQGHWRIEQRVCTECGKMNLTLFYSKSKLGEETETIIYPRLSNRPQCPIEVPQDIAEDYNEAVLILNDSPKASAALSRRCLQHILEDVEKVKPANLSVEIDEILSRKALPSHLSESIDAIRAIGNFAAHPTKSSATREIIAVESGEAEWLLSVL